MSTPDQTVSPDAPSARSSDQARRVSLGWPLALLLITFCSTTAVGMRYMHNFLLGVAPIMDDRDILPYRWVWEHLGQVGDGLPFSLTLMGILLAHEFGHYFACRAYKVRCTLPYMLPAPTLSGTFGAVIRLKSRVRSRAALLTIGAAGPLAGFVVAMGTTVVGLLCSTTAAAPTVGRVESPLLLSGAAALLTACGAMQPRAAALLVPHPILTASWIGCLITALNLVPAGQLDGGHIVYALSPQAHKVASRVTSAVLFLMGIFFWVGWLLWAAVLLSPRMRHPRVEDRTPLTRWQMGLVIGCVVCLVLTATYQPFRGFSLVEILPKIPGRYHASF